MRRDVDEFTRLKEQEDPRTIEEMKADDPNWTENIVESVQRVGDSWNISLDNSSGLFLGDDRNPKGIRPKKGMRCRIYGKWDAGPSRRNRTRGELMWIMGRLEGEHVFASVAVDHVDHSKIAVRTRSQQDAERVVRFLNGWKGGGNGSGEPSAITPTPDADYKWRVVIHPIEYKRLLLAMADDIDYERFKPTIPEEEGWRYEAYLGCWSELLRLQHPDLAELPDEVFYGSDSA